MTLPPVTRLLWTTLAAFGAAAFVVGATTAEAQVPPPATTTIYACVMPDGNRDGNANDGRLLRLVSANERCRAREVKISWNQVGPAGPAGAQGPAGIQGPAGPAGATGPAGAQGVAGTNGTDGAKGPAGQVGEAGAPGVNGANGAVGPQGPAGINGANGAQGPAGAAGAVGPAGDPGAAGAPGANGADGSQGPMGPAGAAGANGAVGPQGPAGIDGANGANGTNGAQGPAGAMGPAGPAGPAGPSGGGAVAPDTMVDLTGLFTKIRVQIAGDPRLPVTKISQVGFTLPTHEVTTGVDFEYRLYAPGVPVFDTVRIGVAVPISGGPLDHAEEDAVRAMEDWWQRVQNGRLDRKDVTVEVIYQANSIETAGTSVTLRDCLPITYDPLARVLTLQVGGMGLNQLLISRPGRGGNSPTQVEGVPATLGVERIEFPAADASGGNTVLETGSAFGKRSVAPLHLKVSATPSHDLESWLQAALAGVDYTRDINLDIFDPRIGQANTILNLADAFPTRVVLIGPTLLRSDLYMAIGVDLTVQAYRPQ